MDLDAYGNVPRDYKHNRMEIKTFGLITASDLILKYYGLHKKGEKLESSLVSASKEFLESEIEVGQINNNIGLGFAILSEDIINVVVWDEFNPLIMSQSLYKFNNGDINNIEKKTTEEEGPFCAYESIIVSHEARAWRKYLASKHNQLNKQSYLDSIISGSLE